MSKHSKKPKSAKRSASRGGELSHSEMQYAAFQALWTTYLHLRAWGLGDFEQLTPEDKDCFRELVAGGRDAIFSHVENCKRAVLATGLGDLIEDEWLGIIGMSDFDLLTGFPSAKRDRLGRILNEMYPLLVRLDPAAAPAKSSASRKPDDLVTMEVALSKYRVSRTTIRRRVQEGKLHDYRDEGAAQNATLMLSRSELDRLFVRW